jgi:outer membrane protein OmpA-like peptidoglycan-associated protein
MINNMPENFTIEFDVFNRYRSSNILAYNFIIGKSANPRRDIGEENSDEASFKLTWAGCAAGLAYSVYEKGEKMGSNDDLSSKNLVCKGDDYKEPATIRFSLWRQKNRLRVYVNEEKVLDIPQAFNSSLKYNVFKLGAKYMNYSNGREQDDQFMVTNLRYAIGAPDTRSKLITQGKFSTTGILFDVNSDKIKAGSYGTLKEIATVLKENATVNVKIIGHTDSDGADASNLLLSQNRAASVKKALVDDFGIDASTLETDGKGETKAIADNKTKEGRAANRRVEFIRL